MVSTLDAMLLIWSLSVCRACSCCDQQKQRQVGVHSSGGGCSSSWALAPPHQQMPVEAGGHGVAGLLGQRFEGACPHPAELAGVKGNADAMAARSLLAFGARGRAC